MGEAIDRCDVVTTAMTRSQALALLGRPDDADRGRWRWSLAGPDDLGQEGALTVVVVGEGVESVTYSEGSD